MRKIAEKYKTTPYDGTDSPVACKRSSKKRYRVTEKHYKERMYVTLYTEVAFEGCSANFLYNLLPPQRSQQLFLYLVLQLMSTTVPQE